MRALADPASGPVDDPHPKRVPWAQADRPGILRLSGFARQMKAG
ncbi:MAG: hypothetical protein PHF70_10050 [Opitutales bacterium]|nr:hypothetical protein [Opitutales bacterium]